MRKRARINRNLGRLIRQLRERSGQSRDEFARSIGVTVTFLGYVERGERNASDETLESIARTLEIPALWLRCLAADESDARNPELLRSVKKLIEITFDLGQISDRLVEQQLGE